MHHFIAPSGIPINLSGVNTSSTSLLISWQPLEVDDQNGIILGYNVTYFSNDDDSVMTVTSDTMISITGLSVYTVYNVSVAAYTVVGTGPSDSITVRTDSTGELVVHIMSMSIPSSFHFMFIVPEAPQNLNYTNLTSTSIQVRWDPPGTFNGPNEGYEVTYRRIETSEDATIENITNTFVNVMNLEIYENYFVEVVALSDKGAGESASILVLTDEDCKNDDMLIL